MTTGPTADVAWIDVLPSMANFMPQLTRGVDAVVPEAGMRAGRAFGSAFGSSAEAAVASASSKMDVALKKVADTAGQVRIAELKLQEAQSSGKASAAQLATAEERVATAKRNQELASKNLTTSTANMSAAQKRATEESKQAAGATEEHTRRTHGLVSALGGVKGAFAAGFGAFVAIKEATDFMGEAMKEAANMQAQVHRINVVFGEGSEAIQRWAESAATRIGMSAQEALAGAGRFGTLFTTMGIGGEEAAKMSEKMVTLGADMAAFGHTDPASAMDALQRAMAGGTRGLRQYGIVLDANMIKEKAHQLGLYSGKGALDVNAKAQATYALVLEKSGRIQGDFTRQTGNVAVQQKVLSAEWTNAKEQLGQLVVGPALGFMGFLSKVVPLLEKSMHWIQGNSTWLKPLALGIVAVAVAWKLWSEAVELWSKIVEMSPAMRIVLIVVAIVTALVTAYKTSETFRNIVNGALHAVGDAAKWMWEVVLKPTFAALTTAWNFVGTAIRYTWNDIIKPTWDFLVAAVQTVGAVATAIWHGIVTGWNALGTAISFTWQNILHPLFTVIGSVVTVLSHILLFVLLAPFVLAWKLAVAAIKLYWDLVLHPVFTAVATVAQWLWTTILKPIIAAIVAGWKALGVAVQWTYQNVILPTWHALQAAAQFMWGSILKPIFDTAVKAWNALGTAFKWVYDNVVLPVWHALQAAASFMWNSVLKPIWSAMTSAWQAVGTGIDWVYRHVIKPVWDAFTTAIGWVRDTFRTAVGAITGIWDGLRSAMKTPVQWVIDVVWNNGLRSLWNTINNIWGGTDIQPFKFADGGVLGRTAAANGAVLPGWTPGVDVHHFYSPTAGRLDLSGGEAVMRPEFTAAVGTGWVDHMNARARAGGASGVRSAMGFADGGIISLGSRALDFLGSGWGQALTSLFLPGGSSLSALLGKYVSQEHSLTANGGGSPIFAMLGDMARSIGNGLWDAIKKGVTSFVGGSGGLKALGDAGLISHLPGGAVGRWAPVVAKVLTLLHQPLAAVAGVLSLIGSESGGNPNAINLWDSNARAGHPSQGLMQTIPSTFMAYAGPYASLGITNPFANIYAGVSYALANYGLGMLMAGGRHSTTGGYVGYDDGGLFPHGAVGINTSGDTERVLNAPQDDYFRRFVDATSSQGGAQAVSVAGIHNEGHLVILTHDVDELMRQERRAVDRAMVKSGMVPR